MEMRKADINRITFEPMIESLIAYGFTKKTTDFYQDWYDNLIDGDEDEYLFTMTIDYENLVVYHRVKEN